MKVAFALALAALVMSGCGPRRATPPPSTDFDAESSRVVAPAASPEALRQALLAQDSSLRIGIVNQVDTQQMIATVGGIQNADFKVNDIVTLNDLTQQPVADGVVTQVSDGSMTVRYNVIAGGRPPRDGDLAIKFTQ